MSYLSLLTLAAIIGTALSFPGEFVPKSYYVIDHNGHQSDVIYFRSKRDVELFPLLRLKRGGGQASAQASASASSSSSSGGGGGGGGYYGGDGYNPSFTDAGFPGFQNFPGFSGGSGGKGGAQSFAGASSSSSSGAPGGSYGGAAPGNVGYNGPILFSRFGEDTGSGVKVSGSAAGEKGAFSSSSSSVDGDGKIKYSVQSGKY